LSRSSFDLIVIGAGTAGLATARRALELGLTTTILEAKDRIGGRAHTDSATFGVPWDRGAHWLHNADRNPFTAFADAAGFAYEQASTPRRLWSEGWADTARQAELDDYYARAFAAVRAAGAAGLDRPATEVIPPHPRFRAMFDSWLAAFAGVDPERLSTLDYARYQDGGGNWPVVDGYGALVARFGQGLPVDLRARALRVRWGGKEVAVETARGTLEGRSVVVTASTSVLAVGGIAFDPPLPARKQEAFAAIPLGEANKVAIAFERDVFGPGDSYRLHIEHRTREAIRFEFRPFGRNLALGYLAGRFAAELEAKGPDAMAAFALDQLVQVFGAGLRKHTRGVASTAWCGDPDILGGYSCARPGFADLRPRLAEPLAERLFFAGEACSLEAYGTVHGAALTGAAAAEAIARGLQGRPSTAVAGRADPA
jgi:monoamine oxidase